MTASGCRQLSSPDRGLPHVHCSYCGHWDCL
ncbi:MAG: hypothetical protein E7078_10920 [Bacteroidales bacterium]|nr:hypothetical protein [Bacteroidales bacterium]